MGRVNSFITGKGGSRKADSELWSSAKKHLSEQTDYINFNRMLITESKTIMSEGLKYHINNQIPLHETIYRYGSESFFRLINEVRNLENQGKIDLCDIDKEIFESTEIGKFGFFNGKLVPLDLPMENTIELNEAEYKGKEVKLNHPMRNSGGGKKYYVYVRNPKTGNVKKISFGDVHGGLTAKVSNPEARKSFAARHKCPTKKDKTKAGYWACRINKYGHLWGGKTYPGFW
jgi:hypothetical protein